jgi:hypothetical protein
MTRQRLFLLVLFVLLLAMPGWAAHELRISAIEPRNSEGKTTNNLSIQDFTSIRVLVQNRGDTECENAVVFLNITETDNEQSILANPPSETSPQIIPAAGQTGFVFMKSDTTGNDQFKLENASEGTYRITATVQCGIGTEHERSLVFSLFNRQNIDIPEIPLWSGALIGLVSLFFFGLNKTALQRKKKTETVG